MSVKCEHVWCFVHGENARFIASLTTTRHIQQVQYSVPSGPVPPPRDGWWGGADVHQLVPFLPPEVGNRDAS